MTDPFASVPAAQRETLQNLRALVHAVAAELPETGGVVESLKWGQLSIAPAKPRVGTAIRLGLGTGDRPALFTHCQTSVMADFAQIAPPSVHIHGNREAALTDGPLPTEALKLLIAAALTYQIRKRG